MGDVISESVDKMSCALAKREDEVVLSAFASGGHDIGWLVLNRHRVKRVIDPSKWETFYLDDTPIVALGPVTFSQVSDDGAYRITCKREVRSYGISPSS